MKKEKRIKIIIAWFIVLIVMLLIFSLSAQVANQSNSLSKGLTYEIISMVNRLFPNHTLDLSGFNHYIRKFAHFFIYLILGFLLINAISKSGVALFKAVKLSFAIGCMYAIFDEFHQYFVPGRGPGIRDVFLDSMGVIVGILLYNLIIGRIKRHEEINHIEAKIRTK